MTGASILPVTVVGIASLCSNSKRLLFFRAILFKIEIAFSGESQIASRTSWTSSSFLQSRQIRWTVI